MAADFNPVQATETYLSVMTDEAIANSNGYVNAGYATMLIGVVLELIIALVLLQSGWSSKWRELAERVTKRKFAQAFIYMPIYIVVTIIATFPLAWYRDFYIEHKFGLATQDFGAWFVEFLLANSFFMLGFSLFVAFLYLILRLSRQRWWMWGAGLAVSFIALIMFLGPLYIQPAFNEYKPMAEGPLKDRILSIARANGMEADDVKQVDESKQTRRISANVSGLFGSSRIALNDNLLERASSDGVEAVMAHEIGHYVLNHQWQTLAYYALIFIFCFAAVNALFNTICRKRGSGWGIRGIDDYAGFPLLYAIGAVLIFLATPVFYKLTYTMEMEADLFAINATRSPDAWSEVALLGAQYRKLRPPQWEENLLNHHPSPYTRIYTAMRWKAENLPVENGD